MSIPIVTFITPNPADLTRCGEYRGFEIRATYPSTKRWCMIFERQLKAIDAHDTGRHEACLASQRMFAGLTKYLAHDDSCPLGDPYHDAGDEDCSCGLNLALAAIDAAGKAQP